jgi:hypothetical protein
MFLALNGDPYGILQGNSYLEDSFKAEVLPQIASGDMLAEMEQFAEDLFGVGYKDDQIALFDLSKHFTNVRQEINRAIAARSADPVADLNVLAPRLIDLIKSLTSMTLDSLDALDIGRYAQDDPAVLIAFAREMRTRTPQEPLDVHSSHLQFVAENYRDALAICNLDDPYERQLAKIALEERASVFQEIGDVNQGFRSIDAERNAANRLAKYAGQL